MKTKNLASKARVSKIPPESYSILALAMAEFVKPVSTAPEPPDTTQSSSENPNSTPPTISKQNYVPETPPSPISPDVNHAAEVPVVSHDGDGKVQACNGKDCNLSIHECGDLDCVDDYGKFYCPSCLYKSAIDEFRKAEEEFKSAMESARFARRNMYEFVGGGTVQKQLAESVEVGGGLSTSGNTNRGGVTAIPQEAMVMDEGQECERNSAGSDPNAGSEEVVRAQVDNMDCENGNQRGNENSGAEIGRVNEDLTSGMVMDEGQECERNSAGSDPNAGSEEVIRAQVDNMDYENGNQRGNENSGVEMGRVNEDLTSRRIGNKEQHENMVDQQRTSVSGGSCDENGNIVEDENGKRNSNVDIGGNNGASTSRICKQTRRMVDRQCSSVSEESSDDNSDGDEGWRQPRQKTNDAGKMIQNGGERRQLRSSRSKAGIESRNKHRGSTNEGNPFSVYEYQDESAGRVGNTNPMELRKRSRETSLSSNEVNISGRAAKRRSMKSIKPESRRQRLRWTSEEEEMLMEAFKICSEKCKNKNMSWVSVLEYGGHVFSGTRTPDDLRDKWRTMVKGRRAKQR